MKNFPALILVAVSLLLGGCNQASKTEESTEVMLNTPDEKRSYALGMMISERILKQYGEVDPDFLQHGISAQKTGKDQLLTLAEAEKILGDYQQSKSDNMLAEVRAKGVEFLKSNAQIEGVSTTNSGLQYQVITATDGPKPIATDTVSVHYKGTLIDGTVFDSSYERGEPATFPLNQVIPGWTEGVQLMSVGSKFKFVIPSHLGYAERGAGQTIGPFETLIFEVELLEIQ
jgi:FKBP-type peptidyl-prolyl cis-trans isomerase